MTHRGRWILAALLVGAALAGCSGSGADGSSAAPGPTAASTDVPPSDAVPQPTPAPDATEGPAPTPAGGGTAAGVCELVTADELAGLFGGPVVLEVLPGVGGADTCDVQMSDAPVAAFVYMPPSDTNGFVFDAWASDPSTEEVGGIGDRAIYIGAQELFVVLRGSAVFSISVYDVERTLEERTELMRRIGSIAAGRM